MAADRPWRLFIALALPPAALAACRSLLEPVRDRWSLPGVRWVPAGNLHLTVRFLGDTALELVPDVALALRDAMAGVAPFGVRLAGAGAFPDGRHPRTLWLGVERGNDGLERVGDALGEPLARLGWEPDPRPRRPHLTVARTDALRGDDGRALGRALAQAASGWSTAFEATAATLYRSRPGGGAPVYEPLDEAPLAG